MVIEQPASPTRETGGSGGPGGGTSKARSVPKLARFVRTAHGRKRFSLKESGISAHDTGPRDWFAAVHRARFIRPWRGRGGSEHVASCRGGGDAASPHPARRSAARRPPPPGEVERVPRRMRADNRISCGSMSFPDLTAELKASMPKLRGRLLANQALKGLTWFRVGGPAQILFMPEDEADLAYLLERLPPDVPVSPVGLGSNLIVRDAGVPGVVVRLGRGFAGVAIEGEGVRAGAAVPDVKVAQAAQEAGIGGMAFFRGNPDMGFAYRHCGIPEDVIFTQALFSGASADPQTIKSEMQAITEKRESTQPVKSRTGGSTFKNPPGQKAWQLIDQAGCRGLKLGDAQVSEMHCNFLINLGNASAADIENLGELVRAPVKASSGVELEWEIRRIGLAQS